MASFCCSTCLRLCFAQNNQSALHVAAEKNHHKIIRLVGRRCGIEDTDPVRCCTLV